MMIRERLTRMIMLIITIIDELGNYLVQAYYCS
jgi:hypothetical protein